MASIGEGRPPNQINKDEDKYWKFTKTQIAYMLVGLFIGVGLFTITRVFNSSFINVFIVVITILLIAIGAALGGIVINNANYLRGGGMRADVYLKRVLKNRRKKSRIIYTSNMDRNYTNSYHSDKGGLYGKILSLLEGGKE